MTGPLLIALIALSQEGSPPWRSDLEATRADCLKSGKPCVLLINVDSPAL